MPTHELVGDDMQAVILTLTHGEEIRAEAGAMMYMTEGIEMDAKMQGGLLGGLERKFLAGESFFIDIERVGGIKTSLFGGGLFFASMTGPGRVWLQTLPFSRLADRVHSAFRRDVEDTKRDLGGALGKLGNLIGGD